MKLIYFFDINKQLTYYFQVTCQWQETHRGLTAEPAMQISGNDL
jgi:hypothetical protein